MWQRKMRAFGQEANGVVEGPADSLFDRHGNSAVVSVGGIHVTIKQEAQAIYLY
jgi:hypothetical protein